MAGHRWPRCCWLLLHHLHRVGSLGSLFGVVSLIGLVLYFNETMNLRWRYRGVHGPKLCLGNFFSVRYVSCFLERKVVALCDTFLTYIFEVCAKHEGVSHYFVLHLVLVPAVLDEKSWLCNEGVQWPSILFEIRKTVSVKCLVCLWLDMLFETFPVLVDVFLLFCHWASRVVWAKVEVSIL